MPYDPEALLREAHSLLPEVVRLRRRIHRRPEIGLTLSHTQCTIIEALGDLDLQITLGKQLSSVVAVLEGRSPGRTVLLRADMDALKIRETTGLDYASEIEGAMHACGHDGHTAMLVGAARQLDEPVQSGRGSARMAQDLRLKYDYYSRAGSRAIYNDRNSAAQAVSLIG